MTSENFPDLKKSLIDRINEVCKGKNIDEILKFTSTSYEEIQLEDKNACEIAKIVKEIAIPQLFSKLGESNKPLWICVICYNLQNVQEEINDHHLCFGTKPELYNKFRSLGKNMFLLSTIPAGQNFFYLDNKSEEHSKLNKPSASAPITGIFWNRNNHSLLHLNTFTIEGSILIRASGSTSSQEFTFSTDYSHHTECWRNHFIKVLDSINKDSGRLETQIKNSINNFITEYPLNNVSNETIEELACIFIPGTPYGVDRHQPFVKDGILICFDECKKATENISTIIEWTKEVTLALDEVIKDFVARPRYPINVHQNGNDLKEFICGLSESSDLDLISQDCLHNPGDVEKDNSVDYTNLNVCNEEKKTELRQKVKVRYPEHIEMLKDIICRDINISQEYLVTFIYARLKNNSIYLGDLLAISQECGWKIEIQDNIADDLNYWFRLMSFSVPSPPLPLTENERNLQPLVIVLEDLIYKMSSQVKKEQKVLVKNSQLTWLLDIIIGSSDNEEKESTKKIHLNFIQDKRHSLHRVIRAIEILTGLRISIYPHWITSKSESYCEQIEIETPADEVIRSLRPENGINQDTSPVGAECLMLLYQDKIRLIARKVEDI